MDELARFRNAAEKFRSVFEQPPGGEPRAFARLARNAVARVYLAAALLPQPPFEDGLDPPDKPRRDSRLEDGIRELLGPRDTFVDVWDPTEPETDDPMEGSLSQELGEIYDDLGQALALLNRAAPNTLWDIVEAFENHWGKHAVDVLRPLHHLAVKG